MTQLPGEIIVSGDPAVLDRALTTFKEDVDKPLDVRDHTPDQVPQEKVSGLTRLRYAGGIQFFSLGPIYEVVQPDKDVMSEFFEATGQPRDVHQVVFNVPVMVAHLPWQNTLLGLPDEVMPVFEAYLSAQVAKRTQEDQYWRFEWRTALITDPIARQNRDLRTGEPPYGLKVACPSGNKARITVIPDAQGVLQLVKLPLDEAVVLEAKAGLGKPLSEQEYATLLAREDARRRGKLPPGEGIIPGLAGMAPLPPRG